MSTPVQVTITVATDDLGAVRAWLDEYCDLDIADDLEALHTYVHNVLLSNSEWDGVPLWEVTA
ncbi:hypothetical protein GGD81_004611 [Rhodobium orientis]|uniref:Uncharacterized protein n=1 Tax=Rhodobium orientis TaxID=34017 RepID=A0A327JIM1_9HYPH|nr:hypothetical protein [Rhodobium orientis]MBB4305531.1 hypothetical protein [Rhodobium orientis]MBK5949128.1 hypothetical protein [Rhodobium orientis]RAI24672.1 hypothetical protein CH339_21600 [Rhodobium orientis]